MKRYDLSLIEGICYLIFLNKHYIRILMILLETTWAQKEQMKQS